MNNTSYNIFLISILFIFFYSCKEKWLDEKPKKSLVVPVTIADFQALLDNEERMNGFGSGIIPAMGEISSDDYEMLESTFNTIATSTARNCYTFQKDVYEGILNISDWDNPYRPVFYANIALEGLQKITPTTGEIVNFNNVKGSAFFFRAYSFFSLSHHFCKPYNKETSSSDLGIILKLKSEITNTPRATLEDTFKQIIDDLLEAEKYLPDLPSIQTRPSRSAVYALLARVYLTMGDYNNALKYSNQCLAIKSKLIDFNTLDPSSSSPFTPFNDEVIFSSELIGYGVIAPYNNNRLVSNELYIKYEENDLRKQLYFRPAGDRFTFKGSYNSIYSGNFAGLAIDEVLLTKAECLARTDKISEAMLVLQDLLIKRYKFNNLTNSSTYKGKIASDENEALQTILMERRKELLFRGTRWLDLRRLNSDSRFAVTVTRKLNGQVYTLLPNDTRYVFLIPDSELKFNSVPQNIR